MTEAENYLWQLIRDRRLNGYKFRRQHPIGGYILDFYCPSKKLAVELDGSQHDILVQKHSDNKRTKDLLKMGIHVIRFWDNDLFKQPEQVLEAILSTLEPI